MRRNEAETVTPLKATLTGFRTQSRVSGVRAPAATISREDGDRRLIQVETTREPFEALRPEPGERLYVRPRQMRIFVGSGS